jgi:hypothetical protein
MEMGEPHINPRVFIISQLDSQAINSLNLAPKVAELPQSSPPSKLKECITEKDLFLKKFYVSTKKWEDFKRKTWLRNS